MNDTYHATMLRAGALAKDSHQIDHASDFCMRCGVSRAAVEDTPMPIALLCLGGDPTRYLKAYEQMKAFVEPILVEMGLMQRRPFDA